MVPNTKLLCGQKCSNFLLHKYEKQMSKTKILWKHKKKFYLNTNSQMIPLITDLSHFFFYRLHNSL